MTSSGICTSAASTRDVILPMTVLRRLDAVLEPSKQAVLEMKAAPGVLQHLIAQGEQEELRQAECPDRARRRIAPGRGIDDDDETELFKQFSDNESSPMDVGQDLRPHVQAEYLTAPTIGI